jgi:hypothetical protein
MGALQHCATQLVGQVSWNTSHLPRHLRRAGRTACGTACDKATGRHEGFAGGSGRLPRLLRRRGIPVVLPGNETRLRGRTHGVGDRSSNRESPLEPHQLQTVCLERVWRAGEHGSMVRSTPHRTNITAAVSRHRGKGIHLSERLCQFGVREQKQRRRVAKGSA